MPIGNAIQKGTYVYVYDEKGRHLFSKPASGKGDGLHGFTSGTVAIREGRSVKTYDSRGHHLSTVSL